jgi:hypothetical protein
VLTAPRARSLPRRRQQRKNKQVLKSPALRSEV